VRLTADWLIPVALAKDRVDKWVASPACSSRVLTMMTSTLSSLIVPGARRRDSSWSPSGRSSDLLGPVAHRRPRHAQVISDLAGSSDSRGVESRADGQSSDPVVGEREVMVQLDWAAREVAFDQHSYYGGIGRDDGAGHGPRKRECGRDLISPRRYGVDPDVRLAVVVHDGVSCE
jgi:hypothetical protein